MVKKKPNMNGSGRKGEGGNDKCNIGARTLKLSMEIFFFFVDSYQRFSIGTVHIENLVIINIMVGHFLF